MKKITLFLLLMFILIALQTRSDGSIVSYTLDITSGLAHTSGGFNGEGIGDLLFDGSFNLIIDSAAGYADLEDIDITLNGPYVPLGYKGFDWSLLEGTYNLGNLSLSSDNLLFPDNNLSGTFDGETAFLQGIVYQDYYDGFIFDCTINAVVIPEPATLLLLGLGGLALRSRRK